VGSNGTSTALAALEAAFASLAGDGGTAALVVRRGDDVLLDLAAGGQQPGGAFSTSTPVFLYSAVKPVAALAVLLAVADGALPLEAPVAGLWPAFGAHGKHEVTVGQALGHGAALPGWREKLDLNGFGDRAAAAHALAVAEPWWTPGEPGEHATSYGHLLDAILGHATGRDIQAWWGEVTATGIGIRLRPGSGTQAPWPLRDADGSWTALWAAAPGIMGDLLRNPPELMDVDAVNGPGVRDVIAPAITGYGSAGDLAQLWSWWTGDAAADRLGRDLRDRSLTPVVSGHDHVLDRPVAWGLGPQVDDDSVGMGGVGGCFGAYLSGPGMAIGFTTADVSPPDRVNRLDPALDALAASRG
jgi:CubicO group peptidase (beta-lactamase class C family)